MIRFWRTRRGLSQLERSLDANDLELPYDGEVMQPLRESLERLLEAHEPNAALIVDGLWNLIESNRAASLLR